MLNYSLQTDRQSARLSVALGVIYVIYYSVMEDSWPELFGTVLSMIS
jgi:hypothetical protein